MRLLARNTKVISYATYKSKTEITDEYGNRTGSYEIEYNQPKELRGYLTSAKGGADVDYFGINLVYTRTFIIEGESDLDESSIVWIDASPSNGTSLNPHNHVVVGVAKSLNFTAYALKEVSTS